MPHEKKNGIPLVSVIIPCYNHGHLLATAIESVLKQDYSAIEILVIDDGSTDHTQEVAKHYSQVRYIFKTNAGLSAARNTGIKNSNGPYLIFLDADDWLYPHAIATNVRYLQQQKELAFVSGIHDRVFAEENYQQEVKKEVKPPYYQQFLQYGNFIGVPAAVMYSRWVLDEFLFDETLKACEDYDLYLKITRKYPMLYHREKIAAYRMSPTSMSANTYKMLASSLAVLDRQKKYLKTTAEKRAYRKGRHFWKEYYCHLLYQKARSGKEKAETSLLLTFLRYRPKYLLKYFYYELFI